MFVVLSVNYYPWEEFTAVTHPFLVLLFQRHVFPKPIQLGCQPPKRKGAENPTLGVSMEHCIKSKYQVLRLFKIMLSVCPAVFCLSEILCFTDWGSSSPAWARFRGKDENGVGG